MYGGGTCPSSPHHSLPQSFDRAGGDSPIKIRRGDRLPPLVLSSLNRAPVSSGCPGVEGLMMKRRGEGPLSPPFSLHTHLGLAQPVNQVQGRPDLQPALGWGMAAWHTQTGRAQGGSQVSSPGQVRARSPGTTPGLLTTLDCRALLPVPVMKAEVGRQHKIAHMSLFCFTDEKAEAQS